MIIFKFSLFNVGTRTSKNAVLRTLDSFYLLIILISSWRWDSLIRLFIVPRATPVVAISTFFAIFLFFESVLFRVSNCVKVTIMSLTGEYTNLISYNLYDINAIKSWNLTLIFVVTENMKEIRRAVNL